MLSTPPERPQRRRAAGPGALPGAESEPGGLGSRVEKEAAIPGPFHHDAADFGVPFGDDGPRRDLFRMEDDARSRTCTASRAREARTASPP